MVTFCMHNIHYYKTQIVNRFKWDKSMLNYDLLPWFMKWITNSIILNNLLVLAVLTGNFELVQACVKNGAYRIYEACFIAQIRGYSPIENYLRPLVNPTYLESLNNNGKRMNNLNEDEVKSIDFILDWTIDRNKFCICFYTAQSVFDNKISIGTPIKEWDACHCIPALLNLRLYRPQELNSRIITRRRRGFHHYRNMIEDW